MFQNVCFFQRNFDIKEAVRSGSSSSRNGEHQYRQTTLRSLMGMTSQKFCRFSNEGRSMGNGISAGYGKSTKCFIVTEL